jgi:hypothetical protein
LNGIPPSEKICIVGRTHRQSEHGLGRRHAIAAVLLGALALTGSAQASIQLAVPRDVVRDLPMHFTASGVTPPADPSNGVFNTFMLDVLGRPASLGPCTSDEREDPAAADDEYFSGPTVNTATGPEPPELAASAPFSVSWTETLDPREPVGSYYMCGWLETVSGAANRVQVPITVRAPHFTLRLTAPRHPRVGRRDLFIVRGTAEAPAHIDAELVASVGYSCANRCVRHVIRRCPADPGAEPFPDADPGYYPTILSRNVPAGSHFTFRRRLLATRAGRWHFCAWVREKGANSDGLPVGHGVNFTVRRR